jgi:hypothetical protein
VIRRSTPMSAAPQPLSYGRPPSRHRSVRFGILGTCRLFAGEQVDPVAGGAGDAGIGVAQGTVVHDRDRDPPVRPGDVAMPIRPVPAEEPKLLVLAIAGARARTFSRPALTPTTWPSPSSPCSKGVSSWPRSSGTPVPSKRRSTPSSLSPLADEPKPDALGARATRGLRLRLRCTPHNEVNRPLVFLTIFVFHAAFSPFANLASSREIPAGSLLIGSYPLISASACALLSLNCRAAKRGPGGRT